MARYQVIFCQGGYSHVDFETDDYSQAQEMRVHLTAQMNEGGERNFTYIIEDTKAPKEAKKPSTYQEHKQMARENAIAYQQYFADQNQSYEELVKHQEFFRKVGKRYGLIKEFKREGIL